ncbi:MAG TPA: hypothetical protein VNO30_49060 [Kofleriaceae bacterium]|nr:hypothetical protein [Kofleriaceae bacterium]
MIAAVLLLASCGGGDDGGDDGPPVEEATWHLLGQRRPSSLLAVWASSTSDVWVVGGREGAGLGPTVYHFDGTAWTKRDTGLTNIDLWQVFGFANGPVFFGGSNGTILRYQNGAFEKLTTPTTDITFGLYGSSPDDVWAVGGQTTGKGFVWRYRGTAFEPVAGLPAELDMSTVWKVTGRGANDVWMSCSRGLVLHWDGQTISNERIGATGESLFSIGCHESRCMTAGTNITNGVLYQNDGQGWVSRVPTPDGPIWRGVTPLGEHAYVVGMVGSVLRLTPQGWVSDPHGLTTEALHAAWSDADGNLFAVGGKFDRALTIDGVMLYKGKTELPALP